MAFIIERIQLGEDFVHDRKVTMVAWKKPPEQWITINKDGSALDNPGKIRAGGIIRGQKGKVVMDFSVQLCIGTNNQAELEASIFGRTRVLELGYRKIVLEVYSKILVKLLTHKTNFQWNVMIEVENLQTLINQVLKCQHIFWEANFLADSLSKFSNKVNSAKLFFGSQLLQKNTEA